MKKRLIALVICLVLCATFCTTVSASVHPRAMVTTCAYSEKVSGTQYKMHGEIESVGTDTLSLTLSLYRISGSNQIPVFSVSDTTSGDYLKISKSVTLISGETYKLVAKGNGSSNTASDYEYIYP